MALLTENKTRLKSINDFYSLNTNYNTPLIFLL